jgi:hypothetical protein
MARQAAQRLVDFLQQFLLSLPDPKREILIGLSGGLVANVGKALHSLSVRQDIFHFLQDGSPLALKVKLDIRVFFTVAIGGGNSIVAAGFLV